MKKIVKRYRISKFRSFMNGLVYAFITVIALFFCINNISDHTAVQVEILFPFCIAILSMLLGTISMLRNNRIPEAHLKYVK